MKILHNFWSKRPVTKHELNLKNTLVNGQAFNWSQTGDDTFVGVLGNMVLKFAYNEQGCVQYQLLNKPPTLQYSRLTNAKDIEHLLSYYFRLDQDLDALVREWSRDKYFSDVGTRIAGVRIFKQEPFECLLSFVVSQNNNIKRITANLLAIRRAFGTKLGSFGGNEYYQFPTLEQLKGAEEEQLRDFGLGYRAKYIIELVQSLKEKGGEKYLLDLIAQDDDTKLKALLAFKGVGNKVADCIRLFSMEANSVVPVDTHVFQIYQNRYASKTKAKVTPQNYQQVQGLFREKFGDYAGWAHSFLFTAELPEFKVSSAGDGDYGVTKETKKKQPPLQKDESDDKPTLKKKLKKKVK